MKDGEAREVEPRRTLVHEVTNAVTIVMGQCFLLQLDETVPPPVRVRLDAIATAADRIAKLIRGYSTQTF